MSTTSAGTGFFGGARGRAGSYAVTTMNSMPWLTSNTGSTPLTLATSTEPKPKARKPRAPVLVNHIFDACAQLAASEDPFWQSIFQQAAYNKMPRGFMYREGFLTFKKGTRIQRLEIPRNPVEALSACVEFFRTMAGIRSVLDQERERMETEDRYNNTIPLEEMTWGQIKKKRVVEALINEFIRRQTKLMNLDPKQAKEFASIINVGFLIGQFNTNSVIFINGRIQGLHGLYIDVEKSEFRVINSQLVRDKASRSKIKSITQDVYLAPDYKPLISQYRNPSLMESWGKYLEGAGKKQTPPRLQIINAVTPSQYGNTSPLSICATPTFTPTFSSPALQINHRMLPATSSSSITDTEDDDDDTDDDDDDDE